MKPFLFFLLCFFLFVNTTKAASDYVLPYPSEMPGSVWYRVNLLREQSEKFWYFGNFAQFTYNLKMTDKYLVEAKTLFEYKQYFLAYKALIKSNTFFEQTPVFLGRANREGKNISTKQLLLKSAAEKHQEVLNKMMIDIPDQFVWQPENEKAVILPLHKAIKESIIIRNAYE